MSKWMLLLCGWLSELSALSVIFVPQPFWLRILLFSVCHLLASTLLAQLFTGGLSTYFNTPRPKLFVRFFGLNFFVPVLGATGTMLMWMYLVKFAKHEVRTEFFNVPLPPFQFDSAVKPSGMGEGGAWSRLRTTTLPREQRLKALLAVGSGSGGNISRFLQLATGDNDDEIRLLAFNLCGRQEQRIQQTISTTLEQLKYVTSPENRAVCCRTLAFAYWEMIYNSLAQDKLQDFFTEQATKYAFQAQQSGETTPDLAILMIRIYLKKQDYPQAEHAIAEALALGADHFRVIPYQAEIAYKRRDFSTIRQLFGQSQMSKYRPSIGPIAQFWGDR